MKCPFDCVNCALAGFAVMEPPAEKLPGIENHLIANFRCIWLGEKIGDVSMHSFPEDKLKELLEMREKNSKNPRKNPLISERLS